MRPASVAAARSSGEMKGCWERWAFSAGTAKSTTSAAVALTVSQRRGSVRSQTHVTPCAARIGSANPNVMTRSGGNHPVTMPSGTPATVNAAHAIRNRRVNPRTCKVPIAASGSVSHGANRRTLPRNRYR
jgi:hypothetical protein